MSELQMMDSATAVESPSSDLLHVSRALHQSYDRLLKRVVRMEAELARANAALESKVAELDAVLRAVPAGVVVTDRSGNIVKVNPEAERVLGRSEESLVGLSRAEVRSSDGRPALGAADREERVLESGGRELVVARTRSVVRDAAGAAMGTIDLLEDRTEHRRLETRVQQQEKLAALGQMSATLAHEVRNPLHSIEGFASLLLRVIPSDESHAKERRYAGNIVQGVRELNSIVTNLLEFSRADRFRPAERDVVRIARRAADLAFSALGEVEQPRYTLRFEAGSSCIARVDDVHLLQALRNLVANAIEAMPEGGEVGVEVAERGDGIAVTISDEGPGVSEELRAKIFQPFFTTKTRGTGLGLAVVAKAASLHGGRIELAPTKKGAAFTLWFPKSSNTQE
ncbi:MAG: PAS domain S-box protein [Planctomycetes bacterium]|nr:PAS domain S-box protein [Planctomycetota bacterium]